ncbi:hypothetical protein D929_02752, partial [Enterococcus faecalis 02-MB-P-10]|uniref:hypothetical protein n=1 Tax=Enterococcus faecalis TaxID=1351 RepID=UPI0003534A97
SRRSILSELEAFYNENIDLVSYGWIKRYTASFSKEDRIVRVYVAERSAVNPLKEYGAPTCLFPIAEMSDERTVPLFCAPLCIRVKLAKNPKKAKEIAEYICRKVHQLLVLRKYLEMTGQ